MREASDRIKEDQKKLGTTSRLRVACERPYSKRLKSPAEREGVGSFSLPVLQVLPRYSRHRLAEGDERLWEYPYAYH
jgi:hypothetical protein